MGNRRALPDVTYCGSSKEPSQGSFCGGERRTRTEVPKDRAGFQPGRGACHVHSPVRAARDSNPARLVLETGQRPARCPWWTWPDSNRLLPPCENGALPGELQAQSDVGVEGVEPSTSWSQARRASTCATRR